MVQSNVAVAIIVVLFVVVLSIVAYTLCVLRLRRKAFESASSSADSSALGQPLGNFARPQQPPPPPPARPQHIHWPAHQQAQQLQEPQFPPRRHGQRDDPGGIDPRDLP